jgi:4-hydroxy-3-methylbut-2-en-1-yl diphosphate reductase
MRATTPPASSPPPAPPPGAGNDRVVPWFTAPERVRLAAPRGYCAGVDRAVKIVEVALSTYGAPVYVRKQIVHNLHVVRSL